MGQYAPEFLNEMQGLAEAAGLEYDTLMAMILTVPFDSQDVPDCTVLAVAPERTVDGRPIVGRNYDFFYDISADAATTTATARPHSWS